MARKMIILGAGASYGSTDSVELKTRNKEDYRPPLADHLVSAGSEFALSTRTENNLQELPALIKNYMNSNMSLEQAVSNIWGTHTDDGTRNQVVCFVFYLASLFVEISQQLRGCGSYYSALCSGIRTSIQKENSFTVVNYNYDTLFDERCGFIFNNNGTPYNGPLRGQVNRYVCDNNLHLIKLHGSSNWWRHVHEYRGNEGYDKPYEACYKRGSQKNDYFMELALGRARIPENQIAIYNHSKFDSSFLAPVVCLPLSGKVDAYVCPEAHHDVLQHDLDEVDQILIIGWSAGDTKLLKDISESIKRRDREITIYLALGSSEESYKTVTKNITQGCPEINEKHIKRMNCGIEALAGSPEYKQFMDQNTDN